MAKSHPGGFSKDTNLSLSSEYVREFFRAASSGMLFFFDVVYPCINGSPFMISLLPVLLIKRHALDYEENTRFVLGKTNKLFTDETKSTPKYTVNHTSKACV